MSTVQSKEQDWTGRQRPGAFFSSSSGPLRVLIGMIVPFAAVLANSVSLLISPKDKSNIILLVIQSTVNPLHFYLSKKKKTVTQSASSEKRHSSKVLRFPFSRQVMVLLTISLLYLSVWNSVWTRHGHHVWQGKKPLRQLGPGSSVRECGHVLWFGR
jgi:hypothetical protein